MEAKTFYFARAGAQNTEKTLELARTRARELGIKTVVIASTVGDTAVKAVNTFEGLKVVVVTHVAGFRDPDTQEFTTENRRIVEGKGGIIVTAAHAFGGIHRALGATSPPPPSLAVGDIVAMTLRTFGQGMKVACEIAAMACDAGHVRTDEEIIAIGGTGRGADTAIVVQPSYTHRYFNLRVKEIICKPRM
ncbi:MAG: hypothetical protein N2506_03795 [Dehalococcoidales bacterium]|nr:hypothetical protein [Dehalococcoidales bacterium]